MSTSVSYKDYEIEARPFKLRNGSGWTTGTQVTRHHGAHTAVDTITAQNVWPTYEQAVDACLLFGKRAIDGEFPGVDLSEL